MFGLLSTPWLHSCRDPALHHLRIITCVAMIWSCAERSAAAAYLRAQAQSMRACSLRWVRQDRAQRRRVGTRTPRWRRCADALFRAHREKSLAARSCTSADFMLATPDLRPFLSMLEDGRYGCSARCVAYGARHRRGGGIAEIAFRCLPMWKMGRNRKRDFHCPSWVGPSSVNIVQWFRSDGEHFCDP